MGSFDRLYSLAMRCDASDKPDRLLDAEIFAAVVPGWKVKGPGECETTWKPVNHSIKVLGVPRYTAALDAVVSLFPVLPPTIPSRPRQAAAAALRDLAAQAGRGANGLGFVHRASEATAVESKVRRQADPTPTGSGSKP